ncbi:CBN-CLC-3 protein [Caenorhabditis brenneri]|uniref:CBN-CLC-3 protein n=1 Tax=Caenorhabditis brenneri TaxID=135651 RepID=G0M7L7_CAEBE|nr:CBN-CLC-3 protein [Caenorhabditis brenneri]
MATQFTGLQVVSWILLLVGTGMLVIALVSDYWSIHQPRNQMEHLQMHRGVLRQCITARKHETCNFRLSSMFKQLRNFMDGYDMYSEKSMYRHLPTQTYEVFVALFLAISCMVAGTVLLFGPFCCQRCKPSTTLLIFITGVFSGSGCAIYWNANREGKTFTLQHLPFQDVYHYDYGSDMNTLSWSFWMAAISTGILLCSAFLLCVSSRVDPDVEYDNPPVTEV